MKKVPPSANKDNVSGFSGVSRVGLTVLFFLAIYFSLPISSTSPPAQFETETSDAKETQNKNNSSAESYAPISTWLEPNVIAVLAEVDFSDNLFFSYRWEMDAGMWSKGLETVTEIATSLTGSISTLDITLGRKTSINNLTDWNDFSKIAKVKEKILFSLLLQEDSVRDKSHPRRLVELALESNIPLSGLSLDFYPNGQDTFVSNGEFATSNILRSSMDIEPFKFREQAYKNARESLGFENLGLSRRDWGGSDWEYPSIPSP